MELENAGIESTPSQALPETAAVQKPKTNNSLIIGLVVLVILLLISTGYLAYDNSQLRQKVMALKVTQTPLPEPTSIQIPQSKTYSNNKFSFEYPNYLPDFKLREQAYGDKKPLPAYESVYLDPQQKGGGPGYSAVIRVSGPEQKTYDLSLEQWLTNQGLTSGGYGGMFQRKHEIKTINGKQVIYQTGTSSGFTLPSEYNLYIPFEDDIYTIHLDIQTNEEGISKYSRIFDQILSTLKF